MNYQPGDRVEVIDGRFKGRTGEFFKYGSNVFPDHCRVLLDLKGRQTEREKIFIELSNIKPITSNMKTDFKLIPLAEIHPDPHQPRKFYDETAMNELTDSVKSKGVLQPVLIRPNGQGFILVCGERRYRASQAAGLTEIPAVIRQLSDDEALELQIIENLQRKDVHPMEEAVAFKSLRDKFSVEDIAIKVGKTPTFVAQRIKLTDLIQDFQEMLYMDKLSLKDAVSLCRISEEIQKEVLKEVIEYRKDWRSRKDFKADRISYYIDRQTQTLDKAPFKTTDVNLYPEAGSCTKCPNNSASNPMLFEDMGKQRICHKPVCYQIKVQRAYQNKIKELISDPSMLFVITKSYLDNDDKAKVKAVEDMGITVFKEDLFNKVEAPSPVEPWEKYKKGWHLNEEDEEDLAACKEQYADDLADYEKELQEYNARMSSGQLHKAFVVAGWGSDVGRVIDISFKAKSSGKNGAADGGNADLIAIEQEIAGIQQREKRNQELDGEKIHAQVQDLLPKCDKYTKNAAQLNQEEIIAMVFAMAESASYSFRDKVREFYEAEVGYGAGTKDYTKLAGLTHLGLNELMRLFILDKLKVNGASHLNNAKALSINSIAKVYQPEVVRSITAAQEEKAAKRQKNVQIRLNALKEKKKQLQAEAKPPAKPKKSKPVKA